MKTLPIKAALAALQIAMILIIATGVLALSACPKTKTDAIRAAVDASYRLPAATNDLIAMTADARNRGIITPDQSRAIGDKLNVLARAEVKFVEMVKIANAAAAAGQVISDAARGTIRDYFDADVVRPFLDVLTVTNVLSGTNTAAITTAVAGVRLLMRTIGAGIGSKIQNLLSGPGIIQTGRTTAAINRSVYQYA